MGSNFWLRNIDPFPKFIKSVNPWNAHSSKQLFILLFNHSRSECHSSIWITWFSPPAVFICFNLLVSLTGMNCQKISNSLSQRVREKPYFVLRYLAHFISDFPCLSWTCGTTMISDGSSLKSAFFSFSGKDLTKGSLTSRDCFSSPGVEILTEHLKSINVWSLVPFRFFPLG